MLNIKHLAFLVVAISLLATCSQAPQQIHLQGRTMGTTYNVKYVGEAQSGLQEKIDQRLVEINKLMSTYDPESELSRFNQWRSTEPFALSAENLLVMQEAKRLGRLSGGALDVTVGPLVNLWGFGPQAQPEKIPSPELITQTQAKTGLDKLQLGSNKAVKTLPELYVDLSTIAKGYGVDQIASLLESLSIDAYLVEIGGEMRVKGVKANGHQWRIAVEKPISERRAVQRELSIGDNAIATSGDYRNYYELGGVRYSHLINPVTGKPIQHNLVSVTVVHPSSMTADGLATALNILGKERALTLAAEENIATLLITKENGEFKEYTSAAFDQLVTTF